MFWRWLKASVIPSTLAFLWLSDNHFLSADSFIHKVEWGEHHRVFGTPVPTAPTYIYPLYICSTLAIPHPGNVLRSLAEYRWHVNPKGMETLTPPAQTQTEARVSGLLLWMISTLPLFPLSVSITLGKKYGHHLPTVSTAVIQVFVDCLVTPQSHSLCWHICVNPGLWVHLQTHLMGPECSLTFTNQHSVDIEAT